MRNVLSLLLCFLLSSIQSSGQGGYSHFEEEFDHVLYLQQQSCYCYHLEPDSLLVADFNDLLAEYFILEKNNCFKKAVTFVYMYSVLFNITKFLPGKTIAELEGIFEIRHRKSKTGYDIVIEYNIFYELEVKKGRVKQARFRYLTE